MEVFDEDKAVAFILNKIKNNPDITVNYNADDILEVIDMIWDYYEDHGMLDLDMSLDESEDKNADIAEKSVLSDYVVKMAAKDKNTRLKASDIPAIVEAELEYEALCDEI